MKAWPQTGDKSLTAPIMALFTDTYIYTSLNLNGLRFCMRYHHIIGLLQDCSISSVLVPWQKTIWYVSLVKTLTFLWLSINFFNLSFKSSMFECLTCYWFVSNKFFIYGIYYICLSTGSASQPVINWQNSMFFQCTWNSHEVYMLLWQIHEYILLWFAFHWQFVIYTLQFHYI